MAKSENGPAGAEAPGHEHHHDHQVVPDDIALRVRALESILVDKQMVDPAALDEVVDAYENRIGPRNGAQVVARAWADPAYKARLLDDGTAAIAELGFGGIQGEHMVVVENTPEVHNLVVCTLCSCYPWPTLGLPPVWYKSDAYRSRAVIEPRAVLRDFGLALDDDVAVQVWDSTAEIRYLVLPRRPPGTEGMTEEELAGLVSRDAMIGVAVVPPAGGRSAMNGIHDMGGMDGFGAVEPEPDEPVFHHPWEGRVFAIRAALRPKDRVPGWGSFRYDLERIPPRRLPPHVVLRALVRDLRGPAPAQRPRHEGGARVGTPEARAAGTAPPSRAGRAPFRPRPTGHRRRGAFPARAGRARAQSASPGAHAAAALHARQVRRRDPGQRRLRAAGHRRGRSGARPPPAARLHRALRGARPVGRARITARHGLRRPLGGPS